MQLSSLGELDWGLLLRNSAQAQIGRRLHFNIQPHAPANEDTDNNNLIRLAATKWYPTFWECIRYEGRVFRYMETPLDWWLHKWKLWSSAPQYISPATYIQYFFPALQYLAPSIYILQYFYPALHYFSPCYFQYFSPALQYLSPAIYSISTKLCTISLPAFSVFLPLLFSVFLSGLPSEQSNLSHNWAIDCTSNMSGYR